MAKDNGKKPPMLKNAPPKGFRELTTEEQASLDQMIFKQTLLKERMEKLDQQVRAAEAEAKAAKLEKESLQRGLQDVQRQVAVWHRGLGVMDAKKDRIVKEDGTMYIRKKEVEKITRK